MAFLGKISAVLTANTQDFTRNVREAGKDLEAFRKQTAGFQLNLNTDSLNKTLTKVQLFQRQVDEIRKQIAANPSQASLFPDPSRMMGQFKALQDVGRPLIELKNKIEGLSTAMQAGLYPELGKIQAGFQGLFREIGAGTTSFEKEEARINGLTAALERLGRTTAVAADFGKLTKSLDANSTGASFFQPRAKQALQESLSLRGDSEKAPARYRGGLFADMAKQAEDNANAIEAQVAKILRLENLIASEGATPRRLQRRDEEQGQLNALTRKQEYINAKYRRELSAIDIAETAGGGRQPQVEALQSQFKSLAAALRGISDTRFEPLINSVGLIIDKLNAGEASAKSAKSAIEALAGAASANALVGRMEGKSSSAFRSQSSFDREEIRRQAQLERNAIAKNDQLTPKARQRLDALVDTRERSGLAREEFNRTVLPRYESLEKIGSGVTDGGFKKELQNIKRLSMDVDAELRRAFSAEQPKDAAAAYARAEAKLQALLPVYEKLEKKAKSFSDAQKQSDMFRSASGGRGDKLDPVLERAASDIMVARQFRGQYAESNITGRSVVGAALEKTTARIETLAKSRSRIETMEGPSWTEERKVKAYQRVNQLIKEQTDLLLKLTAAESGGIFGEKRIKAAAERAAKNTGSFGIAGMASAQLAMQQGLFAIDDFMSSTGGVEYKLRAIGNNISQLGLLLGQSGLIPGLSATTGLFIGMGAVLGGHLAIAIGKAIFNTEELDAQLGVLNSTLSKSQSLAESTSRSFESLSDAIRESVSVGAPTTRSNLEQRLLRVREARQKEHEEYVASRSPAAAAASARRQVIEDRLKKEADIGNRAQLLIDLEVAKRNEKKVRESEASERPVGGAALQAAEARSAALKRQQDETSSITKLLSNNLPEFAIELYSPLQLREAREYRARNVELAQLEQQLAKARAASATGTYNRVIKVNDRGLAAAGSASSSLSTMEAAGVSGDIYSKGSQKAQLFADKLSKQLEKAYSAARDNRQGDVEAAIAQAEASIKALNEIASTADNLSSRSRLGGSRSTDSVLDSAKTLAGDGPSAIGTKIARAQDELLRARQDRDRAILRGDELGASKANTQINFIQEFAKNLERGAIAVASFNRAAEIAAGALSQTLVQEAQSDAQQSRRRANKLLGDPLEAVSSARDYREAKQRQRDREKADRELAETMDRERDAMRLDPLAGRLAEEVRVAREIANNKTGDYTDEQRNAAKARAARAQAELDQMLENRPAVAAAAGRVDAIDAAEARRQEAERKRREDFSLNTSVAGGNIDAARKMFSQAGSAGALIDVEKLDRDIADLRRRASETPAGSRVSADLEREIERLVKLSEEKRAQAIDALVAKSLKTGSGFESQARQARQRLDSFGASDLDAKMTEMEIRRKDMESRRDEAAKAGRDDEAKAIQNDIDAMDAMASEINAATIAIEAFQKAAESAALALQETVRSESEGAAAEARRRANEAEARFGANSPQAKEARDRQARLEGQARNAQDSSDAAREKIAKERVAFEREVAEGRNPAAKARADKIRELDERAANEKLSAAEREAAAAEAGRLRREQEREFEQRPEVQGARREADKADAELQRQRAIDRGRELAKSEMDRRREDVQSKAADVAAYVNDINAKGNRRGAIDAANKAAKELAIQAAPMYAQFGEELANARLQGPSRAALRAQDISTSSGADELNRLLRGEDSSRDVNLVEAKKQTQLLQSIEDTLRRQTGLPVIVG